MNRKTLAILMLIPLLIFVADQGFSALSPKGGKEKKKAAEAQAGPSSEKAYVEHETESNASKMTASELIEEIEKDAQNKGQAYANLDYGTDMIWGGQKEIPETWSKFLDRGLVVDAAN